MNAKGSFEDRPGGGAKLAGRAPVNPPMITVVILNYNGRHCLPATLASLKDGGVDVAEIILADDGSTDGSPEWVIEHYPQVRIVRMPKNTAHTSVVRNAGLREVHTTFVFLTDNDITVLPGSLKQLYDLMVSRPAAMAITPRLLNDKQAEQIYADGNVLHFLGLSGAAARGIPVVERPPGAPRPTFGGGIMMLRMPLARDIDFFDEGCLFGWADDAEFQLRGRLRGYEVLHAPGIAMLHEAKDRGFTRAYAQFVNRYRVMLTVYSGRTLLLLAPSLLLFELAIGAASVLKGAQREHWRAIAHTWRTRSSIRRFRRKLQFTRQVSDIDLLTGGAFELPGAMRLGGAARLGLKIVTALMNLNWVLARPLMRRYPAPAPLPTLPRSGSLQVDSQSPLARRARKLRHSLRDFSLELRSLRSEYPAFVTSRTAHLPLEQVPVFVFHTIEPPVFEDQLRYLQENGYRTLGIEEYFAIASGRVKARGNEVLLTIDDARTSVWRYGVPLLRKYSSKAVLFVITGWTPEGEVRANLDSIAPGPSGRAELELMDRDDEQVCNWAELQAMQSSGVIDIQSHSHRHAHVFVGDTVTGFFGPWSRGLAFDCDASPYLAESTAPHRASLQDLYGAPLFSIDGLCAARPHWKMTSAGIEQFTQAYAQLRQDVGEKNIRPALAEHAKRILRGIEVVQIDAATALGQVTDELAMARDTLKQKIGDFAARYFCIPFTVGSEATLQAARAVGIEGVFWGVEPPGHAAFESTFQIRRIKNDFVHRLPGRARSGLMRVYLGKTLRRLSGASPY